MIPTKAQRVALKRVYDRDKVWLRNGIQTTANPELSHSAEPLTYYQFRRLVRPAFMGDQTVGVPWCGIWLGIEPDGYTHS